MVKAVNGVSFQVRAGEMLGLVGESGLGKTMTCLSILRLLPRGARLVSGEIWLQGTNLATASESTMERVRGKQIGMVLQPPLVILDEPVSSLDVSIRSQILNLLKDLQADLGISYLLISHDLATVGHMSDWIGVMYLGKLVEIGRAKTLCSQPRHPYTATLVAAATPPGRTPPWTLPIVGEVPHGLDIPSGCAFHPRCPYAQLTCRTLMPVLATVAAQRQGACHLYTNATSADTWPPPLPPAAV